MSLFSTSFIRLRTVFIPLSTVARSPARKSTQNPDRFRQLVHEEIVICSQVLNRRSGFAQVSELMFVR